MDNVQGQPWSFTIEFDPDKATRHGYDLDTLYDYVGKNVEPLGNERIGYSTWRAKRDDANIDNVMAICSALALLSRARWVMENIKSLVAIEDDETESYDYLQLLKESLPHLILS